MGIAKRAVVAALLLGLALVSGGCGPSPEQVEQSEETKAALKKELETLDRANDEAARQAARAPR